MSASPRNHVRVLDWPGSDLAHKLRKVLLDGLELEVEYCNVSAYISQPTELRVRLRASDVDVERDGAGRPQKVAVLGIPVLCAEHGLELVEDAEGKKWADLTLMPTTITFDRE